MNKTRLAIAIAQVIIAALAAAMASGLIPSSQELVALLVALNSALSGGKTAEEVRANGHSINGKGQ